MEEGGGREGEGLRGRGEEDSGLSFLFIISLQVGLDCLLFSIVLWLKILI